MKMQLSELQSAIEASGLRPSDIVRFTGGDVKLTNASAWLRDLGKLAIPTKHLVLCLCDKKIREASADLLKNDIVFITPYKGLHTEEPATQNPVVSRQNKPASANASLPIALHKGYRFSDNNTYKRVGDSIKLNFNDVWYSVRPDAAGDFSLDGERRNLSEFREIF